MKVKVFILLFLCYVAYSLWVYSKGTDTARNMTDTEIVGKQLFQKQNCQSCHQIYGMGGYLGTDLTHAISDKNRGETYMKAILKSGGSRMPNFYFTDVEIENIIAFLKYLDNHVTTNTK